MKSKKSLYLVAFYHAHPRIGVKTTRAGWMTRDNNLQFDERVEITRGRKKDSDMASIVLNLNDKKVEKNTWDPEQRDFREMFKYFFKGYHEYITTVMANLDPIFFNSVLDELKAEYELAHPQQIEGNVVASTEDLSTTAVISETVSSS